LVPITQGATGPTMAWHRVGRLGKESGNPLATTEAWQMVSEKFFAFEEAHVG
jgi:hypothetical protein